MGLEAGAENKYRISPGAAGLQDLIWVSSCCSRTSRHGIIVECTCSECTWLFDLLAQG